MRALLPAVLALVLAACEVRPPEDRRVGELRHLIRRKLHVSAHLVKAVDARTVDAVRREVTEADIPALSALLGDEDAAVGYAAQHVLETFGSAALPALQEAARSPDARASTKARDAMATIEAPAVAPSPIR